MKNIFNIFVLFCTCFSFSQSEFHVFPIDGVISKGSPNGNGTIEQPWDLQTALSQTSKRVNGGDIIWLHEGVYKGNYRSTIESTVNHKFITVAAYKSDKVVLDGNTGGKLQYVLEVKGSRVIFKDFEITYFGDFSRIKSEKEFKPVTGINHISGEDCKFQNLIIYNIPGSAIGSWKTTGGTVIEGCIIYNNGYQASRGHGVGIYIQNQSNKIRLVKNNIIFNNYYKGIEVWSATSGTKQEFVKNVDIVDNIIFNNGLPSGKHVDNIIIASQDNEGINVAKQVEVKGNVLYHNVDFNETKNYGDGTSLSLGYNDKSLVEDITIDNNVIIGKNNALNLLHVKSLVFKNNTVYTGYVHFETSSLKGLEAGNLKLNNNEYHTRTTSGLRILKHKDYKLSDWQQHYGIDGSSKWKQLKDFEINPVLKILELNTKSNEFNIALLQKESNKVIVDFSVFKIDEGTSYKIYDIENRTVAIASGKMPKSGKIDFQMQLIDFEKPLHNTKAVKSASNFGVYRIVFEEKKKKKSFFSRLFGWLF